MDFFSRLTTIFMCWSGMCFMATFITGAISDIHEKEWARLWWPRFLKLGVGLVFLASITFAFNF